MRLFSKRIFAEEVILLSVTSLARPDFGRGLSVLTKLVHSIGDGGLNDHHATAFGAFLSWKPF